MTTIDITLASPAVALLIERALRSSDYGFTEDELLECTRIADTIKTARLRVEFGAHMNGAGRGGRPTQG